MGIFDAVIKSDSQKNTTKNFYFGATEAEAENLKGSSLLEYFEDYLGVLPNLEKGGFIFTGRKGVGKSAIAKYIQDKSDCSDNSFAKIIQIHDFNIEKIIQLGQHEDEKEKLLFEWLILVNIVRIIVSNKCGKYTNEYDKLKNFLEKNSGIVNIDQYEFIAGEKNNGGEVSFGGIKHVFGGILKRYFKAEINKAPFYKLIPPLQEIVKVILDYDVNRDLEFWLLFDDLDINFDRENPKDRDKVMELIRVAKKYNNEVFRRNNAKILLFLRTDIRDLVINRYPDSAKVFETYEIPIDWFDYRFIEHASEDELPLKQLANKRIKINFDRFDISCGNDPWKTLFCSEINGKSSFRYTLDFTFHRPRDIITFLKKLVGQYYSYPIDATTHKKNIKRLHKDTCV